MADPNDDNGQCTFCGSEDVDIKRFDANGAKGIADRVEKDLCIFCRHLYEAAQLDHTDTLYPDAPVVIAMARIAHIMLKELQEWRIDG